MFKFFKFTLVVWVLFIIISITLGGGEKLRAISETAGMVVEIIIDLAADKADRLSDEAAAVKEKIEKWTGIKARPDQA